MTSITLPIKTGAGLNDRKHWAHRAREAKEQRSAAALATPRAALPVTVRLVRISAGVLDDDNCQGALKHVRDGVADKLRVDDRDPRVTWEYAQERCKRGSWGVRIEIMPRGA